MSTWCTSARLPGFGCSGRWASGLKIRAEDQLVVAGADAGGAADGIAGGRVAITTATTVTSDRATDQEQIGTVLGRVHAGRLAGRQQGPSAAMAWDPVRIAASAAAVIAVLKFVISIP